MSSALPFMTADTLVQSVTQRILFPLTQNTFNYDNILSLANEELLISAVPALMQEKEEYFVYKKIVPLVNGISIYPIPQRAIGMVLRDIKYSDSNGNYFDVSRINPDDMAFFQQSNGSNQTVGKYYLQNNNIVLTPQINAGATGNLNFFFYLRPNQIVSNTRGSQIEYFLKKIDILDNTIVAAGDTIEIVTGNETPAPNEAIFTAVTSSPVLPYQFLIGSTASDTATNLINSINLAKIPGILAAVGTSDLVNSIIYTSIQINYTDISTTFTILNAANEPSLGWLLNSPNYIDIQFNTINSTTGVADNPLLYNNMNFANGLPSSWTDPNTNQTSTLFVNGCLVDFLKTQPGHQTYTYDIQLVSSLNNIGRFNVGDLMTFLNNSSGGVESFYPIQIGDYICLSNECIIPQIPPELHSTLAERTAGRILMAMGDKDAYAISQAKLAEMKKEQNTLIGSRVSGSVNKVFNRYSLLRMGKSRFRRRY
jgi:hypothetical protein